MVLTLRVVCLIVATVLFIVAALGVTHPRLSTGYAGAAFFAASFLFA